MVEALQAEMKLVLRAQMLCAVAQNAHLSQCFLSGYHIHPR